MHKINTVLTFVSPIVVFLLLSACIYVPKIVEDRAPSCELTTKKLELALDDQVSSFFLEEGFPIHECQGDSCWVQLSVIAAVPIGTALVSGTIVLVGNTVHWIEKQSRCEESFIQQRLKHRKTSKSTE